MKLDKELEELLNRELDDYGITWEFNSNESDDYGCFVVDISLNEDIKTTAYFKVEKDVVYIDMSEDCWEIVQWWETSVKYLWIKIAPELWGNK